MWKCALTTTSFLFLLHYRGCQTCLQLTLFWPLYCLSLSLLSLFAQLQIYINCMCVENVSFMMKFSKYGFSSNSKNSRSVILFSSGHYFPSTPSPLLNCIHLYAPTKQWSRRERNGAWFFYIPSPPFLLLHQSKTLEPVLARIDSGKKCSSFPALNSILFYFFNIFIGV